jgi:ABC-type transporter Mla MlaB component
MSKQSAKKEGKAVNAAAAAATAPAPIRLGTDLGIENAQALHAKLAGRIDDMETVVLDAAEIERVHTAALQLFCLFCRDRRAAGREVEFLRPSETLRNAAALLGATTLLNLARAKV